MILLVVASLLWSVSFALIKSSGIDPDLLSAARLGLAALLFLPFMLRGRKDADVGRAARLASIGALQFGVMYVAVMRSYQYLAGHEVALLTVTTPILVVLFEGLLARRVHGRAVLAALVAVGAAAALRWPGEGGIGAMAPAGLLLVGGANAAWAAGQVLYRRAASPHQERNLHGAMAEFGWMYLGAVVVAGGWALFHVEAADLALDQAQLWKLLYLGLVPSGLAFFLWNRGALRVDVGTLGVMNNLKVPLAVAVALAPPFHEAFDGARLGGSSALLILALLIATWRTGDHETPGA